MTDKNASARQIALDVLYQVFENGAYTNLELDKALFSCGKDMRDRSFVTEIVYGTVKYRDRLDHIISHYSSRPVKKIDLRTLTNLRMAIYQLTEMDKVPAHAVVNEAVTLEKHLTHKSKSADKFVNGLLRSYLRKPEMVKWPDKNKNFAGWLAKYYSFPQWICEEWLKTYGKADTQFLCQWMNQVPELWARCNTLNCSKEELLKDFENESIEAISDSKISEAIKLINPGSMRNITSFKEGKFVLQDKSSMIVAYALFPSQEEQILDLCAAPGGKATHLSALMKNTGQIVACDLHPHRVKLIEENIERLGVKNITPLCHDATAFNEKWCNKFDAVLIDAPCSGIGVLHRRADSRWRKHRQSMKELEDLQSQILDQGAKACRFGGILIYSTCTMRRAENQQQIESFLLRHPEFQLEALPECLNFIKDTETSATLQILPQKHQMDGFYIARMRKRSKND